MNEPSPPPTVHVLPSVDQRERAYQVWAWDKQQNCAEVARVLEIPERTVQHWAKTDNWRLRLLRERSVPLNEVREAAYHMMAENIMPALIYEGQVLRGEVVGDKVRLAAAHAALERVGMGPLQRPVAKPLDEQLPAIDDAVDLDKLTPEERLSMQRELLNRWRGRKKAG